MLVMPGAADRYKCMQKIHPAAGRGESKEGGGAVSGRESGLAHFRERAEPQTDL